MGMAGRSVMGPGMDGRWPMAAMDSRQGLPEIHQSSVRVSSLHVLCMSSLWNEQGTAVVYPHPALACCSRAVRVVSCRRFYALVSSRLI